jgi:hypothetical protein
MVLRAAFWLLLVVPLVAWFVVKPVRVVAPTTVGLHCVNPWVCVEAPDTFPQAQALYDESLSFVNQHVGRIEGLPRVVFCSTQACADQFGLGARSAVTVGTVGTVIGPRAWQAHYVRHELIHHLQGQKWGVLRRLFMPSWLVEGMAYSLSEDPRPQLAEPWQNDRSQFNQWLGQVGPENLWMAADRL